ncbi:hypothetical protein EC900039_3851B, partial [Escherichia coli 90.0039]
ETSSSSASIREPFMLCK